MSAARVGSGGPLNSVTPPAVRDTADAVHPTHDQDLRLVTIASGA